MTTTHHTLTAADDPLPDDDVCEDCGRPCYWDEAAQDYRHTEPGVTCFLITVPTPTKGSQCSSTSDQN